MKSFAYHNKQYYNLFMKLRIYIDTSVIGGCFDDEFREISNQLLAKFMHGQMLAMVSELTMVEIQSAPKNVQAALRSIPEASLVRVELTQEALRLAELYISEGVIHSANLLDAEHIAIATLNRADVLVSWNFKHIVNLRRIHGYNSVNLRHGYPLLEIRSPKEVVEYDESETI